MKLYQTTTGSFSAAAVGFVLNQSERQERWVLIVILVVRRSLLALLFFPYFFLLRAGQVLRRVRSLDVCLFLPQFCAGCFVVGRKLQ